MAGDGALMSCVSNLRQQPTPRGPAFSAEAATGAMTGETTGATGVTTGATGVTTGKTVAATGPGYSGGRELDDQAGHACQ